MAKPVNYLDLPSQNLLPVDDDRLWIGYFIESVHNPWSDYVAPKRSVHPIPVPDLDNVQRQRENQETAEARLFVSENAKLTGEGQQSRSRSSQAPETRNLRVDNERSEFDRLLKEDDDVEA